MLTSSLAVTAAAGFLLTAWVRKVILPPRSAFSASKPSANSENTLRFIPFSLRSAPASTCLLIPRVPWRSNRRSCPCRRACRARTHPPRSTRNRRREDGRACPCRAAHRRGVSCAGRPCLRSPRLLPGCPARRSASRGIPRRPDSPRGDEQRQAARRTRLSRAYYTQLAYIMQADICRRLLPAEDRKSVV